LGNAVTFNGNNQYGQVTNTAVLNPTATMSVAAWIKPTTWGAGNARIVEKGLTDNQYRLTSEETTPGSGVRVLKFHVFNVGTVSANLPTAGFWHHVAGSYDGSKLLLWIDGALAGNVAATGAIPTTADNLFIATKNNAAPAGNGDYFNGTIDDVRIYSRALTNADVAFLAGVNPIALFDNIESGTGVFTPVQGTFSTVSDAGTRYLSSTAGAVAVSTGGSSSWTNYSITAHVKITATVAGNAGPRVFGRFTDLNNRYWMEYNQDTGKFVLQKRLAGVLTTLGTSAGTFTIPTNTEFQVTFKLNGPSLQVWYLNQNVLSASDSSLISGKFGVGSNVSDVTYDDVVINNLLP